MIDIMCFTAEILVEGYQVFARFIYRNRLTVSNVKEQTSGTCKFTLVGITSSRTNDKWNIFKIYYTPNTLKIWLKVV